MTLEQLVLGSMRRDGDDGHRDVSMTYGLIDSGSAPWAWMGGAGGVAQIVCLCGRPMRLLHAWNKASLCLCDACRSTVRVKQSEGERREDD